MNKKRWLIVSVISIATLIALGACHPRVAFKGHFGTPEEKVVYRIDFAVDHLTKTLNLDETQQARVKEMAEACKSRIETHQQKRQKTRDEIIALASQESVTADEITAMVEAKFKEHQPVLELMAENIAELHGMLTPAQRAKLVEEIKNHEHGRCRFGSHWKNS